MTELEVRAARSPGVASQRTLPELLQEDPDSMVEVIDSPNGGLVRKSYRVAARWRWQTFFMRSRGAREFANMSQLVRAGVPCVVPRAFGEVRRWGCTISSFVTTDYCDDSKSLSQASAVRRPGVGWLRTRRAMLGQYGALASRMHAAGFVSTSYQPRNVLVVTDGENVGLTLCDQPAIVALSGIVHSSWLGLIDLYDAAFSPRRKQQFSRPERLRILVAYSHGDRLAARRLWCRLSRRPHMMHGVLKELCRGLGRVKNRFALPLPESGRQQG